ncbi:accessory factor UbiK family protein [Kordiimonas sp. SCSIO 12603]|uniref:accessory factor UbiK family protein n=1 Tax=Kordiimonas sp. SCSIO 12603 TaxID=2829596 RepID=UPI002103C584|nr:accessory factor UbiK family protein [Kordiimonas sp. SCSIO 12603]UTW60118.1 accessory factor UbiK family protein [Kordiimonas sp. SCSIO 12603]
MQTQNKFMDDLAKLATGAVGAAHSVKGEMEGAFQAWLDRQLAGMDLVSREEFEIVRDMAEKARTENEDLKAEIEALKKKID